MPQQLGRTAARLLNRQLARLTQARSGQTVMGLGYALPYLPRRPRCLSLSFMLARQGVIHWPSGQPNRTALVDEFDLPLLESMVDLALVVHGLEHAETPLETLQEVWRVLAPQGRLILVVPNRRGLWAASEATPFGHGQPFSPSQIAGLLKDSKFTVTQWRSALYLPPLRNETLLQGSHCRLTWRARACLALCRRHHRRGDEAGLCLLLRQTGAPPRAALPPGAAAVAPGHAAAKTGNEGFTSPWKAA